MAPKRIQNTAVVRGLKKLLARQVSRAEDMIGDISERDQDDPAFSKKSEKLESDTKLLSSLVHAAERILKLDQLNSVNSDKGASKNDPALQEQRRLRVAQRIQKFLKADDKSSSDSQ